MGSTVRKAAPRKMDEGRAERLAEILKGIAHPLRLRLVAALCQGDHNVTDLTEMLGVRQAAVSQHLAPLRLLGLVSVDRTGGKATYSLAEPHLRNLVDCLLGCRNR
jgi:ArsR family transcriptional regulator